ncbi:family 16 glycosylhydrolase [Pseudoalteromonas piscicida]|uniref:family 16 glycosylhydrolase n=1 Tax=Pseudoalteromonas piscicida TaxID=43662 RepID=UPI0032C191A6
MKIAARKLTRLCTAISVAIIAGCGGSAETETNYKSVDTTTPVSDWTLVWSDEFDSDAIDTSKWTHEVNCDGGGNNEKQCYTDSEQNAFIADGMLNIVATPAQAGAQLPYTSARLNTKYKADFKYGRFEMRAKLPSGQGSWPAFWMLPTDEVYGGWPKSGEIDIMEAVNLKVANEDGSVESNVHGTLHYGRDWPNNVHTGKAYAIPDGVNPADDFHTYAVEWQEGEIRWYVDGYLYATQRQSEVRYNSKQEAVGLKHRGWFAEYYEQGSGELVTHWDSAPFDQQFHLILNLAVGGDWPENVNNKGIDSDAFVNGQSFVVDYVRVYECGSNPETGKGCETVRPGYDDLEDALVEGEAPIPSPPSSGTAKNLTIFDDNFNVNWPAWDCCGGSTPALVSDESRGNVVEFVVGETPTVNGFTSRAEFITDPSGKASPFDATSMLEAGYIRFDMQVTQMPSDPSAAWKFKVESQGASSAAELDLFASVEGQSPAAGEWQTYTFPLQQLADAGLDVSAIDVVMIFPAWGAGNGAIYRVDKVEIAQDTSLPSLTLFENAINAEWPLWDCCGGSTPTEVSDDATHGIVAEFTIGDTPTVMGFSSRTEVGGAGKPFDATAILAGGVVQFEMKVMSLPSTPDAPWLLKIESDNAASAVELPLSESQEGVAPQAGEWQTYTFSIEALAQAGLDPSAIDVVMIFPAWGSGSGAVYRVDNAKIFHPDGDKASGGLSLFKDEAAEQWSIWDCCGGSTPTIEVDEDAAHGQVAQFVIGATPTVMGFLADDDVYYDASHLLETGVVKFDMKVTSAPANIDAQWLFKIESNDASAAVELALNQSAEGQAPEVGKWQTYTFPLQALYDAGLDISAIDVLMVFPSWGMGEGAVYRIDNVEIISQ